VFRRLDSDRFRACFQKFMARFGGTYTGVIAIDGKIIRRSFGSGRKRTKRDIAMTTIAYNLAILRHMELI